MFLSGKTAVRKSLQELIPRYHESCRNHELRQSVNPNDEDKCPYLISIKCLKGHKLTEPSAKDCRDYELTDKPFMWKISIMEQIIKEV